MPIILGDKRFTSQNEAERLRRQIASEFRFYTIVRSDRERVGNIVIILSVIEVETFDHRKFILKGYKDVQKFCATERRKLARAKARKERIARGKNHWYNDLLDFIFGSMHN